jgi:hypothetical protein
MLYLSSPPSTASSLSEPAGHAYDAMDGSFRIGGAAHPSPLVARATRALRAARRYTARHNGGLAEGARLR